MEQKDQDRPRGEAQGGGESAAAKRPWRKPRLSRMRAGSAEVGTRAAGDGAFTTS